MSKQMPKILHYCWFGHKPKPKSFNKYLISWQVQLPEYEIIEWNESNFDINCCEYVLEAYRAKKYAFVADYARLKALYDYGGIYLDTDVEVLKPFTFLKYEQQNSDVILGFEEKNWVCTSTILAHKGTDFIKGFLDTYHGRSFGTGNSIDTTTNVNMLTNWLKELGLNQDGTLQVVKYNNCVVTILPQAFFSPMDYIHRIDNRTKETITVHHYDISWGKSKESVMRFLKLAIVSIMGKKLALKFWSLIR